MAVRTSIYACAQDLFNRMKPSINEKGEARAEQLKVEDQIWISVKEHLKKKPNSKLIFVIRHGKAGNNDSQGEWGHNLCNEYIAQGDKLIDPDLEPKGRDQAMETGKRLQHMLVTKLKADPKDIICCTSSLRRAISTAMVLVKEIWKSQLSTCKPKIEARDDFREWLGWEHESTTDKRRAKRQIKEDHTGKGIDLLFADNFTEEDRMFDKRPLKESWIEVEERWQHGLDSLFQDPRQYVVLTSNNRSIQCGLRACGLAVDTEKMNSSKKITVLNMENCAILALLVDKVQLTGGVAQQRAKQREAIKQQDNLMILTLRKKEKDNAVDELEILKKAQPARFKELLDLLSQAARSKAKKDIEDREKAQAKEQV